MRLMRRQELHSRPFWRGFAIDAKLSEFELTFPDPMHEFNAGDGDRGAPKALQSKHWEPQRSLIDRWSCSIRLFKYFEDRILVRLPRRCCPRISRAARCDAW